MAPKQRSAGKEALGLYSLKKYIYSMHWVIQNT